MRISDWSTDGCSSSLQAMAARAEGLTSSEPAPAIAPEVATPLIHAMLDRQYRATLDEPVGMLGDITPRAAVQTAAGRHRVAGWLKHLENRSSSQLDANDPMATRSEEHTSELQSLMRIPEGRFLFEKKKNIPQQQRKQLPTSTAMKKTYKHHSETETHTCKTNKIKRRE